jgi:acyl-CoA thioesterase YciA
MVDDAMIFGTGYAPFRGGPLNYARTRGPENVVAALRALAAKFGSRSLPRMPAGIVSNNAIRFGLTGHLIVTDAQAVHVSLNTETEPRGDLCIRTLAMPADTNQNGDIFGGWLLSQMDIGGGVFASKIAKSRTVTVAVEAMNFRKPVYVGDLVSVHANLVRVGRTSITVHLEAWVLRRKEVQSILVTDGNFTYVSIDDHGHPQAIKQDGAPIST